MKGFFNVPTRQIARRLSPHGPGFAYYGVSSSRAKWFFETYRKRFVIRHHGALTNYKVRGVKRFVGTSGIGNVYEQEIESKRKGGTLVLRRVTLKLF